MNMKDNKKPDELIVENTNGTVGDQGSMTKENKIMKLKIWLGSPEGKAALQKLAIEAAKLRQQIEQQSVVPAEMLRKPCDI
jgi:hypothetical protein